MFNDLQNDNYSSNTLYNPGKYVICPLNDIGFEKYLSKNSQNYKFLNKYDPELINEFLNELADEDTQNKSIKPNDIQKFDSHIYHNEECDNDNIKNIQISDKTQDKIYNKNQDKKDFKKITEIQSNSKNEKCSSSQLKENLYPKNKPQVNNIQKRRTPFYNDLIKFKNIRPNTQKMNIRANDTQVNKINEVMKKYNKINGPKIVSTTDYKLEKIIRTKIK